MFSKLNAPARLRPDTEAVEKSLPKNSQVAQPPQAKVPPGQYLKAVRERLQIGMRDVQEASLVIASEESSDNFYVSAARLTQIENEESIPSFHKLFSLCSIYGLDLNDILSRYGVNANRTRAYRTRFLPEITRTTAAEIYGFEDKVLVPVRIDPTFRWETTQLVNRVVAMWGEIPAAFLLSCNPRRHTYGYIGLTDRTMFPLLRPGSLLMIDPERRRVTQDPWRNEFERPIYFVELRDGYRCAWCQVEGSKLSLIPHPVSNAPVQSLNLATEAEILGQVVGVAMRLVPPNTSTQELGSKLPAPTEIAK
jgi:transcriptional regulator with XRE-family HTH domain